MSKLGDLFVRLGLKKQDFDKGIDEAQKELKGFGAASKAMATVAAAAWAAVAAAVVKFAKDAVKLTQKWGDEWNVTMAGVRGAWESFVRQLSSGEGFDNLFRNMREAARVARETAAELDKVFERNNSYSYEEAKTMKIIEQAKTDMMDASKSAEERAAASKKVQEEEDKLGNLRVSNAQKEAAAKRDILKSQTQLEDDQIKFLIEEYHQNEALIDQARDYREERAKAYREAVAANRTGNVGGFNFVAVNEAMAKFDEAYDDSVKKIADWTKLYDKGNDELVAAMVEAETRAMKAEADIIARKRRAEITEGRLSSGTVSTGGLKKEADDSTESIKLLEEALERADRKRKALLESRRDVIPMTVDVYGIDEAMAEIDKEFTAATDETFDNVEQNMLRLQELAEEFGQTIAESISGACEELMNQLAGLKDFNPGAVIKALLTPLADMAVKEGEILVAAGVGVEAVKKALESFNGIAAITAGAALIAIGAAVKAGLSALAKGGSTTATTASAAAAGTGGNTTQNIETELTIHVEGRLSGSDIVLAGQKTLDNWSR